MRSLLVVIAMLLPLYAAAGASGDRAATSQAINSINTDASADADLLSMGPDPGGHTGATVTPETTKTDRPNVDAARQSTSGSKTETNEPASSSSQAKKKK